MPTTLHPPGPRPLFPGQLLLSFRRNPINFLSTLAYKYGDISYIKFGPQRVVFLNHPDYIKDILVTYNRNFVKGRALERAKRLLGEGLLTSEGAFHRRQRRLIQPVFHRQRIANYSKTMVDYARRTSAHWQHGETLDIAQEMMRLTLAIVGKTLFDTNVEDDAPEVGAALTDLMNMFSLVNSPLMEWLERLSFPQIRRFNRAQANLDAIIYRMIAERRANNEEREDLLSLLLAAQDHGEETLIATGASTGQMTDKQLRDEALTIFLAGHETTANALTWTWYLLSQYPMVAAQLYAEIDSVLGDRPACIDDLPQLHYTEMTLAESMRLYPPAWIIGRRSLNEYTINNYTFPANTIFLMSQWVMHHDKRYYPNPFRFDPQRWILEARSTRPKFAYFPFGGGPRQCIGESFAWMEGILLIATLAQRWRMRLVPEHPIELQPLITLRPKYGMRMIVEQRERTT